MNFIEISKLIMKGEKIYNLPLRVCFYARVSTDSDTQLNSLENQLDYYKNYIQSKPLWTYVDGYIDEGISGVSVEKRDSFKKMILDAKMRKFDLIITKEVSRFARDLEDSIHYIRLLREANVGIFFENQNINTFDSSSELILNIMFNIAQDESKKLSSRIKFGHRQAIKKGHVLGSSNIIGYKKDNCKLVIVESEAKFIKKVFELYSTEKYGFYKLSRKLGELGFYNKKGNLYDKDTLKRIINNPKYKGFYRGKTSETIDYRTKKRIIIKEEDQVIFKCNNNSVPAIVSEELWDKANSILKSRSNNIFINNNSHGSLKYPFSSKIYCGEHGKHFQRFCGRNRAAWCCGSYLQHRLVACNSPIISEIDLNNILLQIMNNILPNRSEIINSMLKLYKNVKKTNQYKLKLMGINEKLKLIEEKKSMSLDLLFSGELKKETLKKQFEKFELSIELLNKEKEEVVVQMDILEQNKNNLEIIANEINNIINIDLLGEFIRKFVQEIIVFKINNDRHNIRLDIYLNLSDNILQKKNGAKHINNATRNDILYMVDNKQPSIEKLRKDRQINEFTYNVYIEAL